MDVNERSVCSLMCGQVCVDVHERSVQVIVCRDLRGAYNMSV